MAKAGLQKLIVILSNYWMSCNVLQFARRMFLFKNCANSNEVQDKPNIYKGCV